MGMETPEALRQQRRSLLLLRVNLGLSLVVLASRPGACELTGE
jgi:hypothetical protein